MTSHYIDIQLRPDPEIAPQQLLAGVYARLHLALVKLGNPGNIGVSFPAHDDSKPSLGTHLRLHGAHAALAALMGSPWLRGIEDHLRISPIAPAPDSPRHRVISRVQAKSSPERLRRRAMRRHGLDQAAAAGRIPDSAMERVDLPFVTLGSRSTGQPSFPLFVRHGPLIDTPVSGQFSSYGLSPQTTVPWF